MSHHGIDRSNSPALVHGLQPRVAIMNNGTRKGGAPDTFKVLETSPGLEDLWQLHWSYNVGVEHNAPGVFIANIDDNETIAGVLTAPPPPPRGRSGPARARTGVAGRRRRCGTHARLLAQGLRGARRHVHGHESAQRIQQDVPAARLEKAPLHQKREDAIGAAGQLTRSSRGLGRCVRPVFDNGTPSTVTTSAVKWYWPRNRDEPTP